MKKMIASLLLAAVSYGYVEAQTTPDFQKGTVLTATNETLEGSIRDQSAKKGIILFQSASGKKTVYSPAEIAGYSVNGNSYISYASDFYKVLTAPGKARLFQRVTDNSGKLLYNGAEVVSVTTAEGKAGDFYIQIGVGNKWIRITQKDFETTVTSVFSDCSYVTDAVKNKQLDYTQLSKLVQQYNSCSK